jgi:mRNA interferase MazF
MNVQRGDVVLVDYPYAAGSGTKVRPVLVIQNDRDNQRLLNTIVAQITSVTRRALEPTQLLIEIATPAGQQSGLLVTAKRELGRKGVQATPYSVRFAAAFGRA